MVSLRGTYIQFAILIIQVWQWVLCRAKFARCFIKEEARLPTPLLVKGGVGPAATLPPTPKEAIGTAAITCGGKVKANVATGSVALLAIFWVAGGLSTHGTAMRGAGAITLFLIIDAGGSTGSVLVVIVRSPGVADGVPTGHTPMGWTGAVALCAISYTFHATGSVSLSVLFIVRLAHFPTQEKAFLTDTQAGL